jgi:MraZ protein
VGKCGEFEKLFILLPLKYYAQKYMLNFIGKQEAKADVKGRVFIPSAYRKLLPEGEKERVVMRRDPENDYLVLYPIPVWNEMVQELKSNLDEWNPEDQLLLMQFVSDAEWLDIDSQGRILLSKRHLQSIAVEGNDMLFVGLLDRIAVWSKSRYEASMQAKTDFSARLKSKMMKKND